MIIVLIGLPGSGKTTVSVELAKLLQYNTVDLDSLIEISEKRTVANIFIESTEKYFRELESKYLKQVLLSNENNNLVLSTGGGIVISKDNLNLILAKTTVVWLNVDIKILSLRIQKQQNLRPMFHNLSLNNIYNKLVELNKTRLSLYQQAHYSVSIKTHIDSKIIAQQIISMYNKL